MATDEIPAVPAEALLTAILAVLLDEREQRAKETPGLRKSELLLVDSGLPVNTISTLLAKQPEAVRKAIYRARRRAASEDSDD